MPLVITKNFGHENSRAIEVYREHGGYETLKKALEMGPGAVINEVKNSGLRGRGGAGFPTGVKWTFLDTKSGNPIYFCVNADESEPGTFKDRHIMNNDPHLLLEGIIISCFAVGSHKAFVYCRGEFHRQIEFMWKAVEEATAAGFIGKNILGSGFDIDIVIHKGAGAYICGEETGLLSSLEGNKGQPRIKPPFPAIKGLYDCPTVVNNVETICAVPWIIENGADAYKAMGTERSPGTKVFCVSGPVKNPNFFEVELGYPLIDLINKEAGGLRDGVELKACIPGGSSMPILTPEEVAVAKMDYEALNAMGTFLGSGGIVVIPKTMSIVSLLRNIANFYAHESCGQCTPCREGSGWVAKILQNIDAGRGRHGDIELLHDLCDNMRGWAHKFHPIQPWLKKDEGMGGGKTICVFSDALAWPVQSYLIKFRHEFEEAIAKANPSAAVPADISESRSVAAAH
ncbi:MAG: NADH-quinone oxidoreductase subunit NuoF [Planctomycetota bacterium]|nr:NADH-quinone oxidoreductase subunit NuoF [Planctomycetota bacterium]